MALSKSPEPVSAIEGFPSSLNELFRDVTRDLNDKELEAVVKSVKNTFKGSFEVQGDQDLYSCLLLLTNQGLLSEENLTLLETFVAAKASKKEGIKERIENFKRNRSKVTKPKDELKGRESDLQDIMNKLTGTTLFINLYGPGGVGKTTLGKELCLKWPGKSIFVDLREKREMKDVYFHIMLALDNERTVISYDDNPVIERFQDLLKEGGHVLLLLDNVEQFSGAVKSAPASLTKFSGFLHRLFGLQDSKSKAQLKVVLLSREPFRIEEKISSRGRKQIILKGVIDHKKIEPLEATISTELFQGASGTSWKESNEMKKLAKMCKGKPLFLNGLAAILRQKIADDKTLLRAIEEELKATTPEDNSVPSVENLKKEGDNWDYKSEGVDQVQLSCFRKMFFFLPSDTLRHTAIALSLFCRPFTVEVAAFVLDAEMSEATILLEGLRNSELLSLKPDSEEDHLVYDIHPLMRSFLRSVGSSRVFEQVYTKAGHRFSQLYIEKMKNYASLLDKDYMEAFEQFDRDKSNFELALDIRFKTDYVSEESNFDTMVCYLFEATFDPDQRKNFFHLFAEAIDEDGETGSLSRAEMRCFEALEVLRLEGWKTAMEVLKLAEDSLKTVKEEFKTSHLYRVARSSYLFVEGEIYYITKNFPKALKSLFGSLKIMEELWKSHTSKTRCLNAIGNCYNSQGSPEKALEFYTRAYDMRKELSGTKTHFDLGLYKGQIGTVYESLGQYDEAIKCYEEALKLSRSLKRSGILNLALFHRNIVNAYAWKGDYKNAYKQAMDGYEIRKDILGNHPHTARSAFQLAMICEHLDKFEEAEGFFEEAWEIEKSLGNANYSEVRDRIVEGYEYILQGRKKEVFKKEALEFYQRLWDDEKEFSYVNRPIIDQIINRLNQSGDEQTITHYKTEAMRFYEMAWKCPDLERLPQNEREDILQKLLDLCKSLHEKEPYKEYQCQALEFYEQQWEEKKTMTRQDKRDLLCRLRTLAKDVGDKSKEEKYKKLYESSSQESTDWKRRTEKSEEGVSPKSNAPSLWTKNISVSSVITSEGGTVVGEGIKLVCGPGAVEKPVTVTVTLEDPAKYYGFLVQSDLENDVMFCAPIINLQPNGLFFKGPVELTVSLEARISSFDEVVILHGMQTTPTTIIWRDISHDPVGRKQTADELLITTQRFSVIGAFIKKTLILTRDIVYRLNLSAFNYSLLLLFNETSIPNQLAVVFVSEDVKNEAFFQEDKTSVLVQLKDEGFREIMVRSIEGQDDRRIYNQEELKVSVSLGEDYKCSSSELLVVVDSTTWWRTGHAIKVPLENTKQVRILCGRITVKGEYENRKEIEFCELDLHAYIKGSLGVNGKVFNVNPIAKALKLPEELQHQIKEKWSDDECQLEVILDWLKQTDIFERLASLREALEGLKQGYRVTTKRGEMHVKHIRYFAKKIGGLEHESVECERHFANKVHALCQMVLRDCCLQIESTADGVEDAASSTSHVSYITFRMQRKTPDYFVRGCKEICSSSKECIIEKFKVVVPELIQIVKEVFVDDETDCEEQNGLWGISDKTLATFSSSIGVARRDNSVAKLMCDVSQILETLCLQNCSDNCKSKVKRWGKSLANLAMLEFLKPFFQTCPKNRRLHKRLELFFESTRDIFLNQMEFADEVFLHDFANVSLSLVDFGKYDASKLVKFVVKHSINSPVEVNRDNTQYDLNRTPPVFSQTVSLKKKIQGELKVHASVSVHIRGKIRKIGAFQSVIMLRESGFESFEKCKSPFHSVTTTTVKDKDSHNLRVVLCSFQRQELSDMLEVLRREMSEELVDLTKSQVTHCPLTLTARNISAKAGKVLSLRLIYKWGSDSLDLESEDFVICADSSAQGHESTAAQSDEAAATQDNPFPLASIDGNFNFPLSQPSSERPLNIQCQKAEWHFHQYYTTMQGHNCFVGDKPTVHNNPMPAQGAIEEAQGTFSRLSLTDEK
ncbi:uncharacterized protein [Montipora foliosa]|uniref:uncharacterized protein isoform X3 n=1 Tax=Montipora foliosa TaxID=591990 RepID=UPI0035F12431